MTLSEALLWTDGRYHLQASQQLDQNWTLMKQGTFSISVSCLICIIRSSAPLVPLYQYMYVYAFQCIAPHAFSGVIIAEIC